MNSRILLIEDDTRLQQLLTEYLGSFGYEVHAFGHPRAGLDTLEELEPRLVILDVMLPGMDGFEVCRLIRARSKVPVIMLTARGDVLDRVAGLEMGADDYLPKPFEPRELVARMHSVLRRAGSGAEARRAYGRLRVDPRARAAFVDGRDVGLTTNEFEVLALLARNPGKVMDRDTLLQELRGLDADSFNRSVDITMSRLRHKLGDDPKNPEFIKTVWGAGYVFIAKPGEPGARDTRDA